MFHFSLTPAFVFQYGQVLATIMQNNPAAKVILHIKDFLDIS